MEHIDQAEQLRRLRELYAQMSESELRALAGGLSELTQIAQQTLRAEFSRRGLAMEAQPASTHELLTDENDLVDCYPARDSFEARLVMNVLASAGVRSCLFGEFGENVQRLLKTHDTGGIVRVTKRDVNRAREVIALYFSEEIEEYLARCPKCHTPEVIFQGLDPEAGEGATGACKAQWTCAACGHRWNEDGEEI